MSVAYFPRSIRLSYTVMTKPSHPFNSGDAGLPPILGYGHRVSVGFVLDDAWQTCLLRHMASQLMWLRLTQGGCLSPQTIFVEGDMSQADRFGRLLAEALAARVAPQIRRDAASAGRVHEARALAQFESSTVIYGDNALAATVIVREARGFVPSPGYGIVNVVPWRSAELARSLEPVSQQLQAASIAGESENKKRLIVDNLRVYGISYNCKPGNMQKPPISWRENNLDVLASLLLR